MPDMTTCDFCDKPLDRKRAFKVPVGCGCNDYYCDEDCYNDRVMKGEV